MTNNLPMADAELDAIQRRVDAASKGPWQAFIEGPGDSFDSFIRIGGVDGDDPDMYLSLDTGRATDADLEFITAARQAIPRLIAEIKRLRRELDHTT